MPVPSYFSRNLVFTVMRTLALVGTVAISTAHADSYDDVNRLMRAGQYAEAMVKADQYLLSKPRDPQMRFFKGVIQIESGRSGDAITTFTKITEDYPELPEPYNNLAVLYAGQNQLDKAKTALEMAIRTNPSYAAAHENLGDVYARLASNAYSKALQLDSANTGVSPKLALIKTLFSADVKGQQVASQQATKAPVVVAPVITASPAQVKEPVASPAIVATPVVNSTPAANMSGADKEVEAAVNAWADAWSSKNMNAYLSSYGQSFVPPGKHSRKAWEEDRRARIMGKSRISVKLSNLSMAVQGNNATAKFKQEYSADSLNISSRKTLELAKVGDRWVIVKESTGN